MKRQIHACRQLAFLLTGVSAVATLSSCDGMDNPFGSNRPEQYVTGVRRPPALNDIGQTEAPAAPMVSQKFPTSKASPSSNPFDYYDENGNVKTNSAPVPTPALPVETPAPAGASAAKTPDEGNAFTRFIDSLSEPEKPSEPAVRKPLPGNPQYSMETEEVAPVPPAPAPQSTAPLPPGKAFPDDAIVRWNPAKTQPTPIVPQKTPSVKPPEEKPVEIIPAPKPSSEVPVEKNPQASNDSEKAFPDNAIVRAGEPAPVELSREEKPVQPAWTDRWLGEGTPEEKAAKADAEPKRTYPSLSSVPPTPAEFKAVQAANQQEMNALQSDNATAQDIKNSLSADAAQALPSTEHRALLGGGSVPPPPFASPPQSPDIVKKPVERSLWDKLFSSDDESSDTAGTLPSPRMLETVQPPPPPQQ